MTSRSTAARFHRIGALVVALVLFGAACSTDASIPTAGEAGPTPIPVDRPTDGVPASGAAEAGATATPEPTPTPTIARPWLDASLSVAERVELLLSVMTLAEKFGQMTLVELGSIDRADIGPLGIGGLLSGGGGSPPTNSPEAWWEMIAEFQADAAGSRLAIPVIYGVDAVHGHGNLRGATIFPHNIGLGASRDTELVERIGEATATELRATGIRWNFGPTLAVVQDIRWGRTYESYGQDPILVGELGAAYTRGLQSGDDPTQRVVATAKHFVGDGGVTFGSSHTTGYFLDQGDTIVDDATLRGVHLAPYLPVLEAGAQTVMGSFSEINGLHMHANDELLTGVLKDELGFDGFVVSDWAAIDQIDPDFGTAVVAAVNAGIDMNMVPYDYERFLAVLRTAVASGEISEQRIDDAVRRILRVKFSMGLFENPLGDESSAELVGSDEHRALAREAVAKSATLLTNDGVVPVSRSATVAVAGPGSDDAGMQAGGWTLTWQGQLGELPGGTSILDGITQVTGTAPTHLVTPDDWVAAAADPVDVGIVVIGETPYAEGVGDSAAPSLTPADVRLVEGMATVADRVIVVIIAGRPLPMASVFAAAESVIMAWLPGSEGAGVADVVFGERPFTGRLPVNWPATRDQLPAGTDATDVLFPVGHGLTTG